MHLAIVHPLMIWGNYGWAIFYCSIYWLNTIFNIYIWQTINFILAIVNRRNAVAACEIANFHQDEAKGNAILLDFKIGAIFGFANCDQAIQAGLIGIACSLLFGSMFATLHGFIVNKWVRSLDEHRIGWRAKNSKWNDHLDDLASAYARDKRNAPTYPQHKKESAGEFTGVFKKLRLFSK
ncbi:hypothetical protein G6F62_004197 [Rhizopus arrhizus]|uniref:Uncharacterized protein n=1 Tax=Rhizopus oryzae TaxID=64495 RepID=A0A9P6X4J0_RHIOR|nr:hypothetical protein G6F23_008516 [Rhizopus arrhizus]KAG0785729.1 hypothetical protein G6F21_009061 [Rhizopus arrhizus]KAG0813498.1 hypothetical protein G6F20_005521 [Rhizopus arrhizus]KAG0825643.1 hypothetical protein G6F19_009715 [Rhizopus arrhizus]KAG0884922.1 hypothetical protein G6F15_004679 [Rhizopus arrhizus]